MSRKRSWFGNGHFRYYQTLWWISRQLFGYWRFLNHFVTHFNSFFHLVTHFNSFLISNFKLFLIYEPSISHLNISFQIILNFIIPISNFNSFLIYELSIRHLSTYKSSSHVSFHHQNQKNKGVQTNLKYLKLSEFCQMTQTFAAFLSTFSEES